MISITCKCLLLGHFILKLNGTKDFNSIQRERIAPHPIGSFVSRALHPRWMSLRRHHEVLALLFACLIMLTNDHINKVNVPFVYRRPHYYSNLFRFHMFSYYTLRIDIAAITLL